MILEFLLYWQEQLNNQHIQWCCSDIRGLIDLVWQNTSEKSTEVIKAEIRRLFILGHIGIKRRPNIEDGSPMLTFLRISKQSKASEQDYLTEERTLENLVALVPESRTWYYYPNLPDTELDQYKSYLNIVYHNYFEGVQGSHIAIRDLSTDMRFKSLTEACKTFGISISKLRTAIKTHTEIEGHRFCLSSENPESIIWVAEENKRRSKMIYEVTTGITFSSLSEANRKLHVVINQRTVDEHLSCGTYLFCWQHEDPSKIVWKINKPKVPHGFILEKNSGKVFSSQKEAARYYGVSANTVYNAVTLKKESKLLQKLNINLEYDV